MKKSLFFALAVLTASVAGAQGPIKFKVVGQVDNLPSDTLSVMYLDKHTDVVVAKDGRFVYEAECALPQHANMIYRYIGADGKKKAMIFTSFLVEPGTISIKGNAAPTDVDIKVSGTPSNDIDSEFSAKSSALYQQMREGKITSDELDKQISAMRMQIIENNRDKVIAVNMLAGMTRMLEAGDMISELEKLSPEMQAAPMAVQIRELAESRLVRSAGRPFTDFTLTTPDGKELSLSDVAGKGRYLLIDFWASWCGPCVAEIPHLKEVYDKYHDKGFDILGVSLDSKKDAWVAAIEKHGLPWMHVSSLDGWKCQAAKIYGVKGIPDTILIGPDGKIVGSGYRSEALDKKLGELLGQ